MNLPTGTTYIYLAAAPGTGHKYVIECYDNKSKSRKLLGCVDTTIAALNKVNKSGHKLRCNGKWRWARVCYIPLASKYDAQFSLLVIPTPA